jgi:L,D-peptidoglycan transpeptidase YkuD (ErfK/YbiS/YcfS/YnhG family)
MLRLEECIDVFPDGSLHWRAVNYRATLGRGGVRIGKREGDACTPAGCFRLRRVYYRADRVAQPATGLETVQIRPSDGWCSISGHADYNRRVNLPHPGRGKVESLWLENGLYDVFAEIGYNDDPPVDDLGSAVFLHIARDDFGPTNGCVALRKKDLLSVLRTASPSTLIRIHRS